MHSVNNETSCFEVRDLIILIMSLLFSVRLGNRPLSRVRHRPRFIIRTVYKKIDTEKEGIHD
jgi:hypothetical protein